jgi:F-type H+-transporting ATPase subunit delta
MRTSAAARRYARALFSLAKEEGRVADTRTDLQQLATLLADNRELHDALFQPLHPVAERLAVLREVATRLGASPSVRNFFSFLVEQRRLLDFEAIHAEYDRLADVDAGRSVADVVTATPLDDSQRDRLRRALSNCTGNDVDLEVQVDPELLGGVIASVGTLVFDGSLRTQLTQLRTSLTKES